MQISIGNPAARIIERPEAVWITAGLDDRQQAALTERLDDVAAERACRQAGDASIIRVLVANQQPQAVTAWKGLTSCHEVFYQLAEGTEPMITDHFRNALAHVPPPQRIPSDDARCDHFLFRTVPAGATLCRSIRRLGRGERLDLDPLRRRLRHRLFQRVEAAVTVGSQDDYLDRIDHALDAVLTGFRQRQGTVNLFSGGVDSTLIQTYLSSDVPALHYELPHYALPMEASYAVRAADLLGVRLESRPVSADGYLTDLERLIAATAMPPPHVQLAFYQPLMESGFDHYCIGEQADALFGIGLRNARLASPFSSALARAGLRTIAMLSPRDLKRRLERLHDLAGQLGRAADGIDGYAARFGVYADLAHAERLFGRSLISSRLQARLDGMLQRLSSTGAGERFLRHVELAQMMDFLAEDIMMCFRHLALAYGKTIVSPFMTGPLFDAALTIPAGDRYLRHLTGKYLLKALLGRRLPRYPVNQPKGYSHVSFPELCGGALADVWQRYAVPEPFRDESARRLLRHPDQMAWNALTLAIWLDQARQIGSLPGSRTLAFS